MHANSNTVKFSGDEPGPRDGALAYGFFSRRAARRLTVGQSDALRLATSHRQFHAEVFESKYW